jgi:hypothetical protein
MDDLTPLADLSAENLAFLIKIGQVTPAAEAPKPAAKKVEE